MKTAVVQIDITRELSRFVKFSTSREDTAGTVKFADRIKMVTENECIFPQVVNVDLSVKLHEFCSVYNHDDLRIESPILILLNDQKFQKMETYIISYAKQQDRSFYSEEHGCQVIRTTLSSGKISTLSGPLPDEVYEIQYLLQGKRYNYSLCRSIQLNTMGMVETIQLALPEGNLRLSVRVCGEVMLTFNTENAGYLQIHTTDINEKIANSFSGSGSLGKYFTDFPVKLLNCTRLESIELIGDTDNIKDAGTCTCTALRYNILREAYAAFGFGFSY